MNASFIEELTDYVASLEWAKRSGLSNPLRWVVFTNGGTNLHDNVILYGMEPLKPGPTLVVKAPRLRHLNAMLQNEFDRLEELWGCLGDEAPFLLPEPIALATLQTQPLLILSYLNGQSLLRLPKGSIWGDAQQISNLTVDAARSLRFLNEQTATPLTDEEPRHSDLELKAEKFKQLYKLTADEMRALDELVNFSKAAAVNATHKVMNQGDYWYGNMIRGEGHGRLMVVDWQFAHWSVDVSMDVYFFLLEGALETVISTPKEDQARQAAKVLADWRTDIIPAYLDAYGTPDKYVLLPARFGMLLSGVEKAVRSVMDFGFHHEDDVIWRSLFSELIDWTDK